MDKRLLKLSDHMVNRVKVLIQLNHLWHNYQLLKQVHHNKEVMAVVKADAYGHGAVEVASYLQEKGCQFFAVTDLSEAIELRDGGIESNILILGKTAIEYVHLLNQYGLVQTIDDLSYAKALNDLKIDIQTHIVIDSGMSRFGIYCHRASDLESAKNEVISILDMTHLKHQGIYTHFAVADEENDSFTNQQFSIFSRLCSSIASLGYNLGLKHCSNSAGLLKFKDFQLDMVRSGIAMYGYPPIKTELEFLPVMSVYAKVISIRDLLKGDGVSYGLTFKAVKPMKVASIAIGYADGYDRLLSNQDYFLVNGHKCQVIGRVCMGVTVINVTDIQVEVGDFVEIFGQDKPLQPMAEKIGTITYELLTNMSKKRVCFEYMK